MRRAAKVDERQELIVAVLRAAGRTVRCTHQYGSGFPDLLVRTTSGQLRQLEVKSPGEKLTAQEEAYFSAFPETRIVYTAAQALAATE
jgi:hypothetical protein